jgi:hypothetical protein
VHALDAELPALVTAKRIGAAEVAALNGGGGGGGGGGSSAADTSEAGLYTFNSVYPWL